MGQCIKKIPSKTGTLIEIEKSDNKIQILTNESRKFEQDLNEKHIGSNTLINISSCETLSVTKIEESCIKNDDVFKQDIEKEEEEDIPLMIDREFSFEVSEEKLKVMVEPELIKKSNFEDVLKQGFDDDQELLEKCAQVTKPKIFLYKNNDNDLSTALTLNDFNPKFFLFKAKKAKIEDFEANFQMEKLNLNENNRMPIKVGDVPEKHVTKLFIKPKRKSISKAKINKNLNKSSLRAKYLQMPLNSNYINNLNRNDSKNNCIGEEIDSSSNDSFKQTKTLIRY